MSRRIPKRKFNTNDDARETRRSRESSEESSSQWETLESGGNISSGTTGPCPDCGCQQWGNCDSNDENEIGQESREDSGDEIICQVMQGEIQTWIPELQQECEQCEDNRNMLQEILKDVKELASQIRRISNVFNSLTDKEE